MARDNDQSEGKKSSIEGDRNAQLAHAFSGHSLIGCIGDHYNLIDHDMRYYMKPQGQNYSREGIRRQRKVTSNGASQLLHR